MRPALLTPFVCALLPLLGCSSTLPLDADMVTPAAPAKPAAEPAEPERNVVHRQQLDGVLRQGPGWLFEVVEIEEVLDDGKFVGWRVRDMPAEWPSDLRIGDVVTSVNTMPVQTPDQLWAAWTTLTVASELKVTYLRDGERGELSVRIYGEPDPSVGERLDKPPSEEERAGRRQQRRTIVIRGEAKPLTDTQGDW